jgi:hypothetical protein
MQKSNIFVKIYLSFWLATTLVVATQMGLDRLTESGPPFAHHVEMTMDTVLSVYGQAALGYHMRGDNFEAIKLADTLKKSTGISVYLVDQRGNDPRNSLLPQDVVTALESLRQSGKPEFSLSKDKALLARMALAIPSSGACSGKPPINLPLPAGAAFSWQHSGLLRLPAGALYFWSPGF